MIDQNNNNNDNCNNSNNKNVDKNADESSHKNNNKNYDKIPIFEEPLSMDIDNNIDNKKNHQEINSNSNKEKDENNKEERTEDNDDNNKNKNHINNINDLNGMIKEDSKDIIIISDREDNLLNNEVHYNNKRNSLNTNTINSNNSSNRKNGSNKKEEYENVSFEEKINNIITELFTYIHDELGYLHICNYSEGRFLKLCIKHLKKLNKENDDYVIGIYLCYYCLYHIEGLYEVDDHETEEIELDMETIISYIKILGDDIITKFSTLTNKQRQLALDSLDYLNDTIESLEPNIGKFY